MGEGEREAKKNRNITRAGEDSAGADAVCAFFLFHLANSFEFGDVFFGQREFHSVV